MSEKSIFLQIFRDLEAGKLDLPALPDLATKIRDTLRDTQTPIEDVTRILSADTSLTAYIIKIANSPIYVGVEKCQDVQSAIIRLGYSGTRNIAMTYLMRSLFRPKLTKLRPIMTDLWNDVSKLAAFSSVLAERCTHFDPDKALTAAMLQDIGALPLIQKLSRYPQVFENRHEVDKIIDKYAAKVGALIMNKWNFGPEMIEVVRSRKDWQRDPAPTADLADVILIARAHTYIGTPLMRRIPPMHQMPAFNKLNLGELGPNQSLLILDEAKAEINEIRSLLTPPEAPRRKRSSML